MGLGGALPGFVSLASFERAAKSILGEGERADVEAMLVANPKAGVVMRGTGGVRKVRVALPGRGKSGGARVVYYYRATIGRIYLITVFAKSEQANLTAAQRDTMKQLTAVLDAER